MEGVKPRITTSLDEMNLPPEARAFAERALGELRDADPQEFLGSMPEEIPPIPWVPEECRYEIGKGEDRIVYTQRRPVLKQQKQIFKMLRASNINLGGLNLEATKKGMEDALDKLLELDINVILDLLGDGVPAFLAIILTPEGQSVKDKDRRRIQEHLENNLGLDEEVEIFADFFDYVRVVKREVDKRLQARRRLKSQSRIHKI